jgi:hypothetical protein
MRLHHRLDALTCRELPDDQRHGNARPGEYWHAMHDLWVDDDTPVHLRCLSCLFARCIRA